MAFFPAPSLPYKGIGIVEDGDTASRAIDKDQIVIWKGANYYAKTAILQGATFVVDTNLTAIPDGVVNNIVSKMIKNTDIVDNLTTNDSTKVLSAKQGKALSDHIAHKLGYIDTTVTGAINTLDNGVYILEADMPNSLPAGAVVITVEVKAATIFASINATTNKLYLYCMAQKASATYSIRVFYYMS